MFSSLLPLLWSQNHKMQKNLLTENPKSSCRNLFFSQSSPSTYRTIFNQLFMFEIGNFKVHNTSNLIIVQLSPKCDLIHTILSIPTFRPSSKPTSSIPSPGFQLASSFPSFLTSTHFLLCPDYFFNVNRLCHFTAYILYSIKLRIKSKFLNFADKAI